MKYVIIEAIERNVVKTFLIYCFRRFTLEKEKQKVKNNIVSFIPNGDYYFKKALKAIERDQMERAYKYIKRAAELSPDDSHVLMHYGLLEMDAQNFEKAYELIHTAYCIEPDNPEIIYNLAEVSGCLGIMSDAKKYAEKYLSMQPDGIYAIDAKEIIEYVEFEQTEFEDMDDQSYDQYSVLEKARRLMDNRHISEAIELLENLIEEFPDFWKAYNILALAYFNVGDLEQSKALLNHVLRENSGNLQALCNLAIIAYYENEQEKLENIVNVLKKINPFDFENRYKLGATYALIGEYELAYKWLQSMMKRMAPSDSGFYYWLAQAAYFTNRIKEAERAWNILIEIDPSKKGNEPWRNVIKNTNKATLEQNRDYIIEKISSDYSTHRMFGYFLLSTSPYKEEIISHPKLINLSKHDAL